MAPGNGLAHHPLSRCPLTAANVDGLLQLVFAALIPDVAVRLSVPAPLFVPVLAARPSAAFDLARGIRPTFRPRIWLFLPQVHPWLFFGG